jgi:hypothetical protein
MINNKNNQLKIENKIIPLFNVPITMKQNFDIKTNKYNTTENLSSEAFLNSTVALNGKGEVQIKTLEDKVNGDKNMVNLYSKVLKIYNTNLIQSVSSNKANLLLAQGGDTRLNLIKNIKKDNNYEINSIYKNYLYLINRYLPYYIFYNSFFKLGLFLPSQVFKPQFYSLKYKNIFTSLNSSPAFNLRESSTFIGNNSISSPKIPFISRPGLKDIFIGDLASLYYGEKRQNFVKNFFSPLSNLSSNTLEIIGEKINGKSLTNSSVFNKNLLVDNNFLPLTQFKSDITENNYLSDKKVSSTPQGASEGVKNTLISNIWQEEEVNILVNKLIEKGESLNKELNTLILEKKNRINKIKLNNLFYTNNSITPSTLNTHNLINNPTELIANPSTPQGASEGGIAATIKSPILNQYLKSMSIYNMKKKGILIHYNSLINYNFVKGSLGNANKLIFKVYKLLQASFKSMYCLISKPLFIITPDKITIRLFYFLFIPNLLKYKKLAALSNKRNLSFSNNARSRLIKKQYSKFRKLKKNTRIQLRNLSNIALTKIFANKFKLLSLILSKLFKKPVELDLTRLHYPYNDSNILVNLLGIMINKIKLRIIIRRLFEKAIIKNLSLNKISSSTKGKALIPGGEGAAGENTTWKESVNIPAFLSGIKIKVGGRLLTQSVIPRQTVKITQRGATQRGKINFLDVARLTRKNKRGAFSITIKSGQNIF